jgi:hypothetical protein
MPLAVINLTNSRREVLMLPTSSSAPLRARRFELLFARAETHLPERALTGATLIQNVIDQLSAFVP